MGTPVVSAAVEGIVDDAVVRKLLGYVGGQAGTVYGRQGKSCLQQKIHGFGQATRYSPWVVLVDLDQSALCAPTLVAEWMADPPPGLCFRVVIRAVEAWLMADAETLARYLSVPSSRIPGNPEDLPKPKEALVNVARRSRRRAIRLDMVPRPRSGRQEGPAYASRMTEFVTSTWRPEVAARHSDSLRRAIRCLQRLVVAAGSNPAATIGT